MIKGNLSGAPNSRVLDFSLIRLEAAKTIEIPDYERLRFLNLPRPSSLTSSRLRADRGVSERSSRGRK